MKFFKYFIFILLSFLSINAFAVTYEYRAFNSVISGDWLTSPELACKNFIAKWASSAPYVRSSEVECVYKTTDGDRGAQIEKRAATCKAGASNVYSGSVTIQNWKDDNEWLNLNDAMLAKFTGTTVCVNSCIHKFDFLGDSTGDSENGPVTFKGKYVSTDAQCTSPTQGPVDTLNGTKTPSTGCKNGEAYCDKPPTGCPSGYTSGSFNGKQICVKNNPDPTKPNPNDPNNGGGDGKGNCNGTNNCNTTNFDDTKIVNAINDSKNAITSSINEAVNSISNSISTINQSIANVVSSVNATTSAVNNNTTATYAVKASVDSLHNTINAVTTAVDNNTKAVNANGHKVANAVKDNTTATNAVKTAVESLNSSVNAVTDAVNANGDKVANETKASADKVTNAVNSVKSAVDNLNSAVNAVANAVNDSGEKVTNAVNSNGDKITNAINTNGKNTVDAINAGTEATNENGKKLDKIDKNGKDLNDFVMGCKTDSSGHKTCSDPFEGQEQEDGKVDILENEIDNKFDGSILDASASCPPPMQISFTLFQTHTLTYSYETMCNIASYIRPIVIFIGMFIALMIVTGQRSSQDA